MSSPMTTTQIHKLLSRNESTRSLYQGTFPVDLLPRFSLSWHQKPALIVVNHGESTTSGTHWSLIFFPKSAVDRPFYFDSFGNNIIKPHHPALQQLEDYMHRSNKRGYIFNRIKYQDDKSLSCGKFVLAVAWLLARGVQPEHIRYYFAKRALNSNESLLNNIIKKMYNSYFVLKWSGVIVSICVWSWWSRCQLLSWWWRWWWSRLGNYVAGSIVHVGWSTNLLLLLLLTLLLLWLLLLFLWWSCCGIGLSVHHDSKQFTGSAAAVHPFTGDSQIEDRQNTAKFRMMTLMMLELEEEIWRKRREWIVWKFLRWAAVLYYPE